MSTVSTVDIQNNTTRVQAEQAATRTGSSELGQDAFLQLLITQMKHQDPLNPMNNTEFLSQQAQFTQISELQKLNKTLSSTNEMMQASSLIGKQVDLSDPNDISKIISGIVSEAKMDSNGASVVIDGTAYPLNTIISIKEASTES